RLGKDHDHPHAVRPAHARFGTRHLPRLRHPHRGREDQDARRLHDATLLALRRPVGAREPRVRRPHLRHSRPARGGARRDRAARTGTGQDLGKLAEELSDRDGVTMVAPFGASLHVSGREEAALETAISPYRADEGLRWEKSEASLEDVFIELMSRARDNYE